jgi:hypothetical protein
LFAFFLFLTEMDVSDTAGRGRGRGRGGVPVLAEGTLYFFLLVERSPLFMSPILCVSMGFFTDVSR